MGDVNRVLCAADFGISIEWMHGFIQQQNHVPIDVLSILSQNVNIDVDDEQLYSKFHTKNAIDKTLTSSKDVREYLKQTICNML